MLSFKVSKFQSQHARLKVKAYSNKFKKQFIKKTQIKWLFKCGIDLKRQ